MIIDGNLRPPLIEFVGDLKNMPKYLENYRRVFGSRFDEIIRLLDSPMEDYFKIMDEAGIQYGCCHAKDNETLGGKKTTNEFVADFVKQYPDRFIGYAGIDPLKGMEAVRELDFAVTKLGLKGLSIEPFEYKLTPDDRKMYPIYAKCVELDIPISIHSSMNFSTTTLMKYGHPQYFDQIAVDFPELKIIAMNPGFPWVQELVAVAWRHNNVYIQTSATRPLYFGKHNSGYDVLMQYGDNILSNKIIYASSWPMLPFKRTIDEINNLPLKEENKEKWLGGNLARLLKINNNVL